MKILIDGRMYGLEHAGIGRYTVNLVQQLMKLDKKNEYVVLLRKKYFKNLRVPGNWEKVEYDVRHYSLKEQLELPSLIRGYEPQMVHFPHFNVPVLYKDKYVVTLHDMQMHKSKGRHTSTLPAWKYYLKRIGYRFVFDAAVKKSKKVIVPTDVVGDELSEFYSVPRDKFVTTYEGFDLPTRGDPKALEKYGVKPQKYFFYVGSAYPHKNLDRAVEVFDEIDSQFVIAGKHSVFKDRLKEKVEKLGLVEKVKIIGEVTDAEMVTLMKNSIAFFYPSLMEGFGLQGLEAIQSGTLLAASDIPVFREVYGDTASYFNPKSIGSMRSCLNEAIHCNRGKIISVNRKILSKYSWEKMAKKTLLEYSKA